MGTTSIYKDLHKLRAYERRKEFEANWCDAFRCKEEPVEGSLLCEKHRAEAEQHFTEQLGIDPLWHMQHDIALRHGGWAWTYFVGNRDLGIVKIGVTTRLKARMSSLRNSSPVPIKLFAVVFGDQVLEKYLHNHFAAARKHGEWFDLTDELARCIDELKSHKIPECIPRELVPDREERCSILAAEIVDVDSKKRPAFRAIERLEDDC